LRSHWNFSPDRITIIWEDFSTIASSDWNNHDRFTPHKLEPYGLKFASSFMAHVIGSWRILHPARYRYGGVNYSYGDKEDEISPLDSKKSRHAKK
jgi:hypothetical protein